MTTKIMSMATRYLAVKIRLFWSGLVCIAATKLMVGFELGNILPKNDLPNQPFRDAEMVD
jgi:hypothetical protein